MIERAVAHTRDGRFLPHLRAWVGEVVRLALAVGDRASAARAVSAIDAVAAVTDVPSVHAAALAAHGRLDRDPDFCAEAVKRYAAGPRIVAHAEALETLAEVQAERGMRDDAIDALRDAFTKWRAMGAVRDARRVAAALRSFGVRTAMPPVGRPRSGWGALSATENAVSGLISEGLTNAQIAARLVISKRTAESHVAHVMAKLDVRSRSAIARIVTERRTVNGSSDE